MATESSRKMGGENPSLSANDLKLTALQESLSLRDLGRWPTSLPRLQTSLSPGFRRAGGAPTSLPRLRRGVAKHQKTNQRSSKLGADLFLCFAEREGFEPPEPFSSTVFKTAVIDHSTISPRTFRWDVSQTDCKGKQKFWFCKFFMKILQYGIWN